MKKKYLFIIILAIILLLVFGAYYFYMKYFNGGIKYDNEKCFWEPGLCKKLCVGPAYYYNSSSQKCELWERGGCCTGPPFKTLEECKNTCLTEKICDAKNSCPGEMSCVKLPEKDSPTCLTDEEFNNYLCLDGNKPQIFESSPLQFICE